MVTVLIKHLMKQLLKKSMIIWFLILNQSQLLKLKKMILNFKSA